MKASLLRLPFVVEGSGGFDLWNVSPTGDWADDNARGRAYAALFLKEKSAIFLTQVVKAMVAKGKFGGIETGFIHRIAERAINEQALGVQDPEMSDIAEKIPAMLIELQQLVPAA